MTENMNNLQSVSEINDDNISILLKEKKVNNILVWILAFTPIIGIMLEYLIYGSIGMTSGSFWRSLAMINSVLCVTDERMLKKAGYNTRELLLWAMFFVPVYLFRRAYIVKDKKGYATVWCITFTILLLVSLLTYQIRSITYSNAVRTVEDATVSLNPNLTLEQMVDSYFENPEWNPIVAKDGKVYVNVTGKILWGSKTVKVLMQYKVNADSSCMINALEFNGVQQDREVYDMLILYMEEQ